MRSRLAEIVRQMEIDQQRKIEQREIAAATGLDENTISRWMQIAPFKTIRVDVLARLCQYTGKGFSEMLVAEHRETT